MTMPPENPTPDYSQGTGYNPNPDYSQGAGYNPNPGYTYSDGAPPLPVRMLKALAITNIVLVLIRIPIDFMFRNALTQAVRGRGEAVPSAGGHGMGSTIFSILWAVLFLVLAMQVAKHNNPSRVVLGVIGVIGAFFGVIGFFGVYVLYTVGVSPVLTLLSAALIGADVAISSMFAANAFNNQTAAWTGK